MLFFSELLHNIALGRFSSQTSTSGLFISDRANDGFYSTCSQTAVRDVPWWEVKLDGVYEIKKVEIRGNPNWIGKLENSGVLCFYTSV